MTVDIYSPTANDGLGLLELELYNLVMDYRARNGLPAIPLSAGLTITAGRHAADTYYNIWEAGLTLPPGANQHSWSDNFYYEDHRDPEIMWQAPQRLGTTYPGNGYEASAGGFATPAAALEGWKGSPGHNAVILNLGAWEAQTWNAVGIGIEHHYPGGAGPVGGSIYHLWFGAEADPGGAPAISGDSGGNVMTGTGFGDRILGLDGADRLLGGDGNDTLEGGDGPDTLNGGNGDDLIAGGDTEADRRDVIYAGAGDDSVDGGHGNDQIYGQDGEDTLAGGFGADTLEGQAGDDVITGSAFGDQVFGNAGNDFVNGGFGHDLINGGSGADKFFHVGIEGHGSDWVQDYSSTEGDVLVFGNAAATAADFRVTFAHTENREGERAGEDGVEEAFVIYRPTGQVMWALVDGGGQASVNLRIGAEIFDLLA